jgi:hypothetical protein
MADGKSSSDGALDSVERLRSRLASLDQSLRGSGTRDGNSGNESGSRPDSQGGQNEQGESRSGQSGAQGGRGASQSGEQGGQGGQGGQAQGAQGGVLSGPVGGGDRGGYRGGFVNGGWNAGNNTPLPHRVAPDNSLPSVDTSRTYEAGVKELGNLRRAVGEDPESRRQVDELIRSMQKLDPKRFPGNPAMVDELVARVLSGVDRLELQLRHVPDESLPADVRSDNPSPVPAGYQGAVAEYFRRLSKNP